MTYIHHNDNDNNNDDNNDSADGVNEDDNHINENSAVMLQSHSAFSVRS